MRARKRSGTRSAANSTSRPPESAVFFLDESLDSDFLASALRAAGARVERLTEHFPKGTPDEVWLARAGAEQWIVLTRDKRIRYRQLEKVALKNAGVRAFVFIGGNVTLQDTAEILTAALPRMYAVLATEPGPWIYHIGRAGKPLRMA